MAIEFYTWLSSNVSVKGLGNVVHSLNRPTSAVCLGHEGPREMY